MTVLQIHKWLAGWLQVRAGSPALYGDVAVAENGPPAADGGGDGGSISAGDAATESLLAATEPISSSSTQGPPPCQAMAVSDAPAGDGNGDPRAPLASHLASSED